MLYGEEQIRNSKLESFPNPNPERDYWIEMECPEFTCICPRSGFPDFAHITIKYVPDEKCVELKSLKLYINQYRNEKAFHEAVINKICDDLVKLLEPREILVEGDFNVRGNIRTVIKVSHCKKKPSLH